MGLWLFLAVFFIAEGCSGSSANNNNNTPTKPTPRSDLPPLPAVLQKPSSADDLATKIKTLCEQETQNVHNVIRCQGKYTSLYCEHQGGTWATFDNGCADRCDAVRNPALSSSCRDDSPFGCDCGKPFCWTGLTCEAN